VFPLIVQEKIKIILNVLYNDWRLAPFKMPGWSSHFLFNLKDEDIDKHFAGLDENSLTVLKRFLNGQRLYFIEEENMCRCFYSRKDLYTREEYKDSVRAYKKDRKVRKKIWSGKIYAECYFIDRFSSWLVNAS
jgi:hypothetical protein